MDIPVSTLQLGLIAIGVALVVVVYVYNVLQERRIRKRMDEAFKVEADPLPEERGSPPLANEPAGIELPDPDIECVARLQGVSPIPGAALVDAVGAAHAKPCRWVGRQVSGVWSSVREPETYTEVAACM